MTVPNSLVVIVPREVNESKCQKIGFRTSASYKYYTGEQIKDKQKIICYCKRAHIKAQAVSCPNGCP